VSALTTRGSTRRGMLLIALGVFTIGLQDPIVKSLMGGYPVTQAVAIRSAVAVPILLALVLHAGGLRILREGSPRRLIARGFVMMLSYTLYFLAFPAMPLANVVALFATAPLFVVLLSRVVLAEPQGWQRWTAVLVGFGGALVVAQPSGGAIGWSALLPIGAALGYALAQVLSRRWHDAGSATAMSFHANAVYLVGALAFAAIVAPLAGSVQGDGVAAFLLRPWEMPTLRDGLLLAACGPIAAFAFLMLTKAYREAPPGAVTPLEYTTLLWASLWGFLFFQEVPTAATISGAALIIASGLFAVSRASGSRRAR
jgi:drug/metabolite transporter (DMT)-like permease